MRNRVGPYFAALQLFFALTWTVYVIFLPRLAAPLGPLLLAAARGRLLEAARPLGLEGKRLPALPIAAVGIVLAAAGYPDAPSRDDPIDGLDRARDAGALVFHGGTAGDGAGGYRTAGGRILTVVGRGPDLEAARARAETAADLIAFAGAQRRHDIGADGVPLGASR